EVFVFVDSHDAKQIPFVDLAVPLTDDGVELVTHSSAPDCEVVITARAFQAGAQVQRSSLRRTSPPVPKAVRRATSTARTATRHRRSVSSRADGRRRFRASPESIVHAPFGSV